MSYAEKVLNFHLIIKELSHSTPDAHTALALKGSNLAKECLKECPKKVGLRLEWKRFFVFWIVSVLSHPKNITT